MVIESDGCGMVIYGVFWYVLTNRIMHLMYIHCIYRLIWQVKHVARYDIKFRFVIETVSAASGDDINEGITMSAFDAKQFMVILIFALDNGYNFSDTETFLHNICFFHCIVSHLLLL